MIISIVKVLAMSGYGKIVPARRHHIILHSWQITKVKFENNCGIGFNFCTPTKVCFLNQKVGYKGLGVCDILQSPSYVMQLAIRFWVQDFYEVIVDEAKKCATGLPNAHNMLPPTTLLFVVLKCCDFLTSVLYLACFADYITSILVPKLHCVFSVTIPL